MPTIQRTATYLCSWLLFSTLLSAYKQSTAFHYDAVEQVDAASISQPLPTERKVLIDTTKLPQATTAPAEQRSEFEIDYQNLGTSQNTNFRHTVVIGDQAPHSSSAAASFNFESE